MRAYQCTVFEARVKSVAEYKNFGKGVFVTGTHFLGVTNSGCASTVTSE